MNYKCFQVKFRSSHRCKICARCKLAKGAPLQKVMAHNTMPKLSVIAQYDDLCRYTKVLTEGCEEEFKIFVESQKRLLKKRQDAIAEIESLRKIVSGFEYERQRYENQLKHLKNTLVLEVERRKTVEKEKSSMERQIEIIKEVLLTNNCAIDHETKEKLFQLSSAYKPQGRSSNKLKAIEESIGSLLSSSEYDQSDEDTDIGITQRKRLCKGKRGSGGDRSMKRKKSEGKANRLPLGEAVRFGNKNIAPKRSVNFESSSDPISTSPDIMPPVPMYTSDSDQIKENVFETRKGKTLEYHESTPVVRHSTGGKRGHVFVIKTFLQLETCYPCGQRIKFYKQALKCTNCRVTCHPECKEQCVLPCIPGTSTPTKVLSGTISDFAPSTSPMIPSIIVHCINEIESRGLKEVGLYRVNGLEPEVKGLKGKFLRGKSLPTLNKLDIHAVCGTVKEFLRSLTDSLITKAAWKTFVDAASQQNETQSLNMLLKAVCNLPQANRDTLAFLVLHLQRIAGTSENKMTVKNLSVIFGPTVVGYSVPEPSRSSMFTETRQQCDVMERLLMIPADSWQNLLNIETGTFYPYLRTPEVTPAPVTGRLGPIRTPSSQCRSTPILRTPLKPRTPRTNSNAEKRRFFSSPRIK